jgi:hypothetical protein
MPTAFLARHFFALFVLDKKRKQLKINSQCVMASLIAAALREEAPSKMILENVSLLT